MRNASLALASCSDVGSPVEGGRAASAGPRGRQGQVQLRDGPGRCGFQSACGRTTEQRSSWSLCLHFEPTGCCLDEDDLIARGDMQCLPDADGERDPSAGLDSSGSLHGDRLTGFQLPSRAAGHSQANGVDRGEFTLLSGRSGASETSGLRRGAAPKANARGAIAGAGGLRTPGLVVGDASSARVTGSLGSARLGPSAGDSRGCRRQLRRHVPSRLDWVGSPMPVPSLQGHRRQNALRQVWPEDRQLAFE